MDGFRDGCVYMGCMSGCVVVGVVVILKGWVYGGCRDKDQSGVHYQL